MSKTVNPKEQVRQMHGKKKRDVKIYVSLVKMKQWHCRSQGSGNIGEITVLSLPCAEPTQTHTI